MHEKVLSGAVLDPDSHGVDVAAVVDHGEFLGRVDDELDAGLLHVLLVRASGVGQVQERYFTVMRVY